MLGIKRLRFYPQLSTQLQKPHHQTKRRSALLCGVFCELSFVVAPKKTTEPPISVDCRLTQLIGQRAELINEHCDVMDQHNPRVWHREAGLRFH